jgi:hypothetical protein
MTSLLLDVPGMRALLDQERDEAMTKRRSWNRIFRIPALVKQRYQPRQRFRSSSRGRSGDKNTQNDALANLDEPKVWPPHDHILTLHQTLHAQTIHCHSEPLNISFTNVPLLGLFCGTLLKQ